MWEFLGGCVSADHQDDTIAPSREGVRGGCGIMERIKE